VKVSTQSLRADLLLKAALGLARNKIEMAFYEGKIRLNGKKLTKKSASCSVGDELDLVKEDPCPKNPEHIIVGRIEILSTVANEDSISVTMKRFKNLTIARY
jgi:23S rRNA-/tRNA-specific pseudouridylate synthase